MDRKSIERDTRKLLLSQDYIDMEVKTLNKIKGGEVILVKKLHSLLTRSTEKTCLSTLSSSGDNRELAIFEYSTTINRMCPFIRM